jgi:FixJ family two-component response regulator
MSTEEKVYPQQLNILTHVLEDDEDIIQLLDELFKMNGFVDYLFFKESAHFVKALNERVHICVIDYYLPGTLNGLDVMKVVLGQNPWCKVIMISGQDNPKVIEEFVNNDGFRYVSKSSRDYENKLVTYIQQAIALIKKQIDMHEEFKSVYQDLKTKRKKVDNTAD